MATSNNRSYDLLDTIFCVSLPILSIIFAVGIAYLVCKYVLQ